MSEAEEFAVRADRWACFDAEGPCIDFRDADLRADLRMYAKLCLNDPAVGQDPGMLWEFFLKTPAYQDRVREANREGMPHDR